MVPLLFILSALVEGCASLQQHDNQPAAGGEERYSVSGGFGCCPDQDHHCENTTEIERWPYEGIWYESEEGGRNKFLTTKDEAPVVYYCKDYFDPRPHLRSRMPSSKGRQTMVLPEAYPRDTDCFLTKSAKACVLDTGEGGASSDQINIQEQLLLVCPLNGGSSYRVYLQARGVVEEYACQSAVHPSVEYRQDIREAAMLYSEL